MERKKKRFIKKWLVTRYAIFGTHSWIVENNKKPRVPFGAFIRGKVAEVTSREVLPKRRKI